MLPIWMAGQTFTNSDEYGSYSRWGSVQACLNQYAMQEELSVRERRFGGEFTAPVAEIIEKARGLFSSTFVIQDREGAHESAFLFDDEGACIITGSNENIWVFALNEEFYKRVCAFFEPLITNGPKEGSVYTLVSGSSGLQLRELGKAAMPFEPTNYNTDVVASFEAVVKDLNSKKPRGRLAVFDGEPGTGKTTCLRGMIGAVPGARFVVVPTHLIPRLADPGTIEVFMNHDDRTTVLLVEDADDCLMKRDASNVSQVSALLNLGDGIVGSALDIRIVCTTNLQDNELDAAVLRPGRLSKKVYVGKLTAERASQAFERITGRRADLGPMTIAEVYALSEDPNWESVVPKKRSVGFGT